MMSSDRLLTKGISMIPMTRPATKPIWFCTVDRYSPSGPPTIAPKALNVLRSAGPTVRAAKKP
jgi:hypothetical protein